MKKLTLALGLAITVTGCASTIKIDDPIRPVRKLPYMLSEWAVLDYNIGCEWQSEPEPFNPLKGDEYACILDKWATVTIKLTPDNENLVRGYGNEPRKLVDKVQIFWKQWPEDLHASRNHKRLMAEAAGYVSWKFLPQEAAIPFVEMILDKEDKKMQTRYWDIDYKQSESGAVPLGIVTMNLRHESIPEELYDGVFYNLNNVDLDNVPVLDPSIASEVQPVDEESAEVENNNN